ncbi:glycosyltransferase family 2 protein [Anaerocolumna sedimenticola]|uniref:glycosyltransferase family 2 protein n=1 Tax=Anaerocolumna sedimenticola TaxID=2696063 RepID=UPI002ED2EE5B
METLVSGLTEKKDRTAEAVASIVIPIYGEGSHILNSIRVIDNLLKENHIYHKFILIDDGSKDNTWQQLEFLAYGNTDITAIRLSRNFGKEAAICAGLEYADGDYTIVMDSDLQHPPELIPEMVKIWREEGYDVVEGVKNARGKEKILYSLGVKVFYKFIYKTSNIDLSNASDFKLLDKKVIMAWKQLPERTTFFRGMSAWVGFSRKPIGFDVKERVNGKSKWSMIRLIKLALNAITSYTTVPLHFITLMGIVLFILFLIIGIQTIYMKITGRALDGFTTVILLQLIIGGSVMISLGIIGIYLTKIYHEVKARPRYLIAKCIKGGKEV